MRVLIAGAGAVGGYLGACLARAGEDVTLFARGPHLRAMQQHGLRVISAEGDFVVHPRVTGTLNDAEPADAIVLGVKAHSLTQFAPQLAPLIGENTIGRQHAKWRALVVFPGWRRRAHWHAP